MLNDTILNGFTKTYAGKTYLHTTAIRHKGMVIAFAMDDRRRIWYATFNTNPTGAPGAGTPSPFDVNNWPASPVELLFPNEIAETGFGVAGQTSLPAFQNGSRVPVAPGVRLDRRDRDLFLSGTARFTAAAPFQVLTDGSNIYLFRQAIDAGHADMVWTDKAGHRITSSDGARANMVWADEKGVHNVYLVKNKQLELAQPQFGEPAPLVNSTLLVDRFVLVGAELQSRMEVRFQRSRNKTRPQSRKDSLGAKDLDGNNFYEPTQELRFVGNLNAGRFSVLLLPTSVSGVERWQIFAQNANTGRLDSFNVERSAEGLFNTRGSQAGSMERHAESALHFEKSGDFVSLNPGVTLGAKYTQEAWIFPDKTQSVEPQALFTSVSIDPKSAPSIWIEAQTKLRVGFGDGQQWQEFTSRSILTPNAWNHLAVTFDGKAFRFYVGGTLREKIDLPEANQPADKPVLFFGAAKNGFTGIVDEIRFWDRARSAAELKDDMSRRLTGLEPGLIGYWRFDEGNGITVFDQTNNGADGTLTGGTWVNSDAPVGENPGIHRSSFRVVARNDDGKIEPRLVASGMAALLYFQQANVASGYDGKEKPLKQNARVMLTLATQTPKEDDKPYIAALDFGVSASGRIAQVPDNVVMTRLTPAEASGFPFNQKLDSTGDLQNEIRLLELDIERTKAKIDPLSAVIQVLADALDNPASFTREIADKNFIHLNPGLNALKNSAAALDSAQKLKQQLDSARVTVFEHSGFAGKSKEFGTGFVGASTLSQEDLHDRITSLRIDPPLQVRAYEHANRGGESILFTDSTSNVGDVWNDRISSMDIEVNPTFAADPTAVNTAFNDAQKSFEQAKATVQGDLNTLQAKIVPLQREKSGKETRLTAAQFELKTLKFDLKNGVSVAMPLLHLDPFGLSVSGGLLGFAWTKDAPLLFDSATGSLALYFRGDEDQFFAAYFNTFTEKAKYPLADVFGNNSVLAVARSNDLDMDKLELELSGDEGTPFCTLRIEGAGILETWDKLPRNPVALARVLNGEAGHYSNNRLVGYREFIGFGTVANNEAGQLTLEVPDGIGRALEAEATLMVGDTRVIVQQAAASQARKVFITSGKAPVFPGSKAPVFFMEYDYAANATTTKVPGDLFGGSLLLRAVALDGARPVTNQRATGGSTITSAWVANSPGSTLAFDGKTVFAKAPQPTDLSRFDIKDDVTLETWLRPNRVEEKARIIYHRSGASDYTLGLSKKDLNTALELDGSSCVDLNAGVVLGEVFTLEAWIFPTATDNDFHGIVGNQPGTPAGRSPSMWVTEKTKLHAGFGDGASWHSFITDSVLVPDEWNHVAFAFDGRAGRIFVNGLMVFEANALADKVPAATPVRFIGKADNFFKGKIDEVRLWKRARTQEEINSDRNHRLAGNERDLVGYWHFDNKTARDFSRNNNNGVLLGNPVQTLSPLPAFAVYAGVNGKYVETRDAFPAGSWTHLAVTFVQRYGLQFDGISGYLDCGNDDSLNINTDLTIEVFFQNGFGRRSQAILTRGVWSGGSQTNVPYALAIDADQRLVFSFEDEDGNPHVFTSSAELTEGKLYRVAVTRKQQTLSYFTTKLPKNRSYSFVWHDIVMYIDDNAPETFVYALDENIVKAIALAQIPEDSAPVDRDTSINNLTRGNTDQQTKSIGRSDKPLIVGRTDQSGYFRGIISEMRIWNKKLDGANVLKSIQGNEDGLVSLWRFEERNGSRALDSKSRNHATINGNVQWVKDPELLSSGMVILVNGGNPLVTIARNATDFGTGSQNFSLGALPDGSELFQGELEELRVWKNVRTEEQIQDNLFRRLNSELDQLVAYYTFDAEEGNQLNDNALRGNNLAVQGLATYLLSTAPISDDAPQVRSALAGIRTPFSGFIQSTPAVQEYGDMQFDAQGNLIGVFKRCYGLIKNSDWQLISGFKVGDLVTEWIGQVQFAPQLMGFIEGAPPVPSENLTQPSVEMIGDLDDYNEASKIELTEAAETTYTYSSSKEQSFGLEVDLALKFGIKSDTEFGAGIGAVLITKVEESKAMVGVRTHFEAMWGWSEEAGAGVGRNKGKTTGMELRGRYTSPEENENEPFGRRFLPDNMGLALVQSETADVFALRLRHNNALISFSMRPNPNIEKDWNLISFPINPRYTKQGTLDGKIGPITDPDYPNAFEYNTDSSYFKPVEAYALKNKIKRQETELETYYQQFDAQSKGQKAYFPSDSALELAEYSELKKILHRNIVNSYVWTSDGGLFAETNQNKEMQTESTSGKYEFKGSVGLEVNIGFSIMKVGAIFELSAMFIGQHQLSISKSKESETSFELNVSVDKIERDIYQRDAQKVVIVDHSDSNRPKPVKTPFKVDAYRFMTFYLEQHLDHFNSFFNSVVDPLWLKQSDHPSASALREAQQSTTNCWRVMHRVTYVSRVLPPLDHTAPPSLEKILQTLDIDSNYELIRQLEPYVGNRLGSFTDFTNAVRQTIEQRLPELRPHTEEVIQYLSLYFGIADGSMPDAGQSGENTLLELAPNQPPIVNAGLDRIIGLDGASVSTELEAVVIDDRLERTEAIFVSWEKLEGEGDVLFDNLHAAKTTATFTKRGRYVLRLQASDGMLSSDDTVVVIVDERPVISAGPDQEVFAVLNEHKNNVLETLLPGVILHDGLGDGEAGKNRLTVNWSLLRPQGDAVFTNKNALITKATFQSSGHFMLQLSVSNGTFTTTDEVLVAVAARTTKQLQALYTFEENGGAIVRDVSGAGAALDLQIVDTAAVEWLKGGLKLKSPALLISQGAATRLLEAVKAANELTVEAWIQPAAATAEGLARILTLSAGPAARNVLLGQTGGQFHLGLRSSTTNLNASNKALTGGGVDTAKPIHVVCTRNAEGLLRMYVGGAIVASRNVTGNFSNWANDFQLALGNETGSADGIDRAWLGAYHLVALYSRALTEQEVLQNFRFGADENLPPIVSAGSDVVVNWPEFNWPVNSAQKKIITLKGDVTHDRATAGSIRWTQAGGPTEGVKILQDQSLQTQVELTQKGRYVFRLTADDGKLLSSNEVVVTVHCRPHVEIISGTQHVALDGASAKTSLEAVILDSGLGDDSGAGAPVIKWSRISGPASLQLTGTDTLKATATSTERGLYDLQLELGNGNVNTKIPLTLTVDQKPVMTIAPAPVITLPANQFNPVVSLNTGLGNPAETLLLSWENASGPEGGTVTFDHPEQASSAAVFSKGGVYRLRLTAANRNRPELVAVAECTVVINQAPVISIGAVPASLLLKSDQANVAVLLDATVSDDGLPDPPGVVVLKWSKISGPANVTFKPDDTDFTEVKFTQKGKYGLQLEADDNAAKTAVPVTIVVNTPPVVDAGPQQKVTVKENDLTVSLKGVIKDKGFGDETPQSKVTVLWEKQSGPTGSTEPVITGGDTLEPTVKLPKVRGTYVFKMTANNGFDSSSDTVAVIVHVPPMVSVDVFETEPANSRKRQLSIQVRDNGLGNPEQGALTFSWKKTIGQEPVTFQTDPNNKLLTTATFPKAGSYKLELTVGNGSDLEFAVVPVFAVKIMVDVTVV